MRDLITALDVRKEHSYNLLFKKLYKPLCFFAYKILQDQDRAEDIVQDCFLKIWIKGKVFDKLEQAQSYLYLSVKNACLDDLEHQTVRLKHQHTLSSETWISDTNVLDMIIETEVLRKILDAIDGLPAKCKEVINLTYSEGKSIKEISELLGVTVSTVTNQKLRGIALLKQKLSYPELAVLMTIIYL